MAVEVMEEAKVKKEAESVEVMEKKRAAIGLMPSFHLHPAEVFRGKSFCREEGNFDLKRQC